MKRLTIVSLWTLAVAFGAGLAVATPAAAQDADLDGVSDLVDLCPGTAALELVNSTGCSVCPCEATWASHTAYVNCVTTEAYNRYQAGLLTRKQRTAVITHAKNSTCGIPGAVRCCTWRKLVTGSMGSCAVIQDYNCTFAIQGKWAENRSTGSCYYNPCTW